MQMAAAERQATSQQQDGAKALGEAREHHARELSAAQRQAAAAEAAAAEARRGAEGLRRQRAQELEALQARFTAVLQTKDGTIAALTCQLQELHAAVA